MFFLVFEQVHHIDIKIASYSLLVSCRLISVDANAVSKQNEMLKPDVLLGFYFVTVDDTNEMDRTNAR